MNMKPKLKIGDIEMENPFLLAPMAGVTDVAFRRICHAHGAAMVYAEMVSAKGLYYRDKNTESLLRIGQNEGPVAYQIFGSEPEIIAFAAETLNPRQNALLDINMGCPVPKVVKNGEGSALLKKLDLAGRLVEAAVSKSQKPVTAKIRIGWDSESVNAVETAKVLESAGASAIAVHGRTREQYYSGKASWDEISKIKENVRIPVIGNGDIFSGTDAMRMIKETGCDFVMIARGALGNPWIFEESMSLWAGGEAPPKPEPAERLEMLFAHFDALTREKTEGQAVREMRKHAAWYLKGVRNSASLRRDLNTVQNEADFRAAIIDFKSRI